MTIHNPDEFVPAIEIPKPKQRWDVTPTAVFQKAIQLAAANPEHVYKPEYVDDALRKCYYTPTKADPGGCVFGQAMIALGVPTEALWELDFRSSGVGIVSIMENYLAKDDTADSVRYAAGVMQSAQDRGEPWGMAAAMAMLNGTEYEAEINT